MSASIYQSEIKGKVTAPSSKSYTIRGLICAALARGKSEIIHPLSSDDTEASQAVLGEVGIRVFQDKESVVVGMGNMVGWGRQLVQYWDKIGEPYDL